MSFVAICLVLISALFHAFRNLFTKQSDDKQIFTWLYTLCGMLLEAPLFFYFLPEVNLTQNDWFFCIGSGFIHFIYYLLLAKAYEGGDLSSVYPITRSAPAPILLFAVVFLGEDVSLLGACGIALVVGGVYVINMTEITVSGLLGPIRLAANDRSTRFAFLTLLSVTVYSLVDKAGVTSMHPVIFAFLHLIFSVFFLSCYNLILKDISAIRNEWAENRKSILCAGFVGIFGYLMALLALSIERVSYVAGLRQLSIVFAVVLGNHVLGEGHRRIRYTAASIILFGSLLIAIAG